MNGCPIINCAQESWGNHFRCAEVSKSGKQAVSFAGVEHTEVAQLAKQMGEESEGRVTANEQNSTAPSCARKSHTTHAQTFVQQQLHQNMRFHFCGQQTDCHQRRDTILQNRGKDRAGVPMGAMKSMDQPHAGPHTR